MRFGPIDFQLSLDRLNDVVNDITQKAGFVDRGEVRFQCVVESHFIGFQVEFRRPLIVGILFLFDLQHRSDHGGRVDQVVVILLQRLFEQLAERLRFGGVLGLLEFDLIGQQLGEQFQSQVFVRLILEDLQEPVIQDRQVGLRQASRAENVEHPFRFDVLIHQIANGLVEFTLLRLLPWSRLGDLIASGLQEDHFVGVASALIEMPHQKERRGQLEFRFEELLAEFVGLGEVSIDQRGQVFFFNRGHAPPAASRRSHQSAGTR